MKDIRSQDTVLTWKVSIYMGYSMIRSHFSKYWIHWLTALQDGIYIWHHKALLEKGFTFKILETSALYHTFFYGDSFKFSFDLGLHSATGCIVRYWG